MFRMTSGRCREIWSAIVAAPGIVADRGGRLPTDMAFVVFAIVVCLPITLVLALPFVGLEALMRLLAGGEEKAG
jgi:hypothetical protein